MWPTYFIPTQELGEPTGFDFVLTQSVNAKYHPYQTSRVDFSNDGTEMYFSSPANWSGTQRRLWQISLATPWDVSTAVPRSAKTIVLGSSGSSVIRRVKLSTDGAKLIALSSGTTGVINLYSLATPKDIATISGPVSSYSLPNRSTSTVEGRDFDISDDGTKIIVLGWYSVSTTQYFQEYTISTPWDLTTTVYVRDISVPTTSTSVPVGSIDVASTGDYIYAARWTSAVGSSLITRYNLTAPWSLGGGPTTSTITSPVDLMSITLTPDGTRAFLYDRGQVTTDFGNVSNDSVLTYDLPTPYSLGTMNYDSAKRWRGYSSTTQGSFALSADGLGLVTGNSDTYLYNTSTQVTTLNRWSLTTANDLNTARPEESTTSMSTLLTGSTLFRDMQFSPDGTMLFVLRPYISTLEGHRVTRFILTTPWDVRTISSASTRILSATPTKSNTQPMRMVISGDGLRLCIMHTQIKKIYQHTFSTAWTIGTLSTSPFELDTDYAVTENKRAMFYLPDGSMFFVYDVNAGLARYNLSTPWNIASAVFERMGPLLTPIAPVAGTIEKVQMISDTEGVAISINDQSTPFSFHKITRVPIFT